MVIIRLPGPPDIQSLGTQEVTWPNSLEISVLDKQMRQTSARLLGQGEDSLEGKKKKLKRGEFAF